jgi:hypothetical protein
MRLEATFDPHARSPAQHDLARSNLCCPTGEEDKDVSMGVVLCGSLPFGIRAGVTLRKKTVEAPYSKLGSTGLPGCSSTGC